MANVLDLRRRIRSVKNTRQITKAMKMVAAARLRRAQERAVSARPYSQMLNSVIASLMRRIEVYDPSTGEPRHPLLLSREEKTVLLIVISGDKGFAGGFNANITKAAFTFLTQHGQEQLDIEAIGRKGRDLFRRRFPAGNFVDPQHGNPDDPAASDGASDRRRRAERHDRIEVTGDYPGLLGRFDFARVSEIGREVVHRYVHEEIDAAYIVYNEFRSVISQRVVVERILPIIEIGGHDITAATEMDREERERAAMAAASAGVSLAEADTGEADAEAQKFGTAQVDYIYEQPPRELLDALLPQYVSTQIYHAMIESVAAEEAARMTAMDSATNNASDMIDAYTLQMNRVRQAAITKEIIEIVSGAAAL